MSYGTKADCYAKVLEAANDVLARDSKRACDPGAAYGAIRSFLSP